MFKFNSNQSPSESESDSEDSDVTDLSVTDVENIIIGIEQIETFEWTTELENWLLLNMVELKSSGINKHLSVLLLKEKISKELKINIPMNVLWNYLSTKWNIRAADIIERIIFDTSENQFALPEEFDQLIEKSKNLDNECLNDEINKKKSLNWRTETRSKSNSMSSVDSKEGLDETLLESSQAKTNEVGFYDGPCTRRSLPTNDKLENSKSDEKNKLKDMKQINEKTSNQSKDVEKIEKISNYRGRKRRSSNVSESNFSSNNSKQGRYDKNKLTDLTILDSSSRSVTPQILSGKTSNRSVTSETISRKSNLRSCNKDQKSKLLTHSENEANN